VWHIVGLKYVERGHENAPREPCIIIANHQSPWETLVLASKFPNAAFVAKKEMKRVPIVGWFLTNYPMILIERGGGLGAIRKLIRESSEALEAGRSVIIFPEGTRKSVSDKIVFKRGIEFLYSELRQPIFPIVVNSGVFWGPDRLFKFNGTITISYLPPIMPGLSQKEFKETTEALMQAEKEHLVHSLGIDPWLEALG
jgi:1-acyl-sn-glycerol-3-phosphate acyltransferase